MQVKVIPAADVPAHRLPHGWLCRQAQPWLPEHAAGSARQLNVSDPFM